MKTLYTKPEPSEDISDVFSPEGIQKLKTGQLLRFNQEGSITEFVITKLNRKSNKVFARRTITSLPKDVEVKSDYETQSFEEYSNAKDT